MRNLASITLLLALFVVACGSRHSQKTDTASTIPSRVGYASFYSDRFQGRRTASGERYDKKKLTAAHPSLPFGTLIRVTNRNNGCSVVVRINDRGPSSGRRVVDVSKAAAKRLGMVHAGVVPVELAVVRRP